MEWNNDNCYDALAAHDRRFDGRLFVGVSSTGIYCRPVCTAKLPKRENCTFYKNAASAEREGYRPCLRCRPELAPGNSPVDASSRLAATIASMIENGNSSEVNLQDIAISLNISDRHLRRVVQEEFGVTPVELSQTYRLLFAKQLLTDTKLSISEIAFASGFKSLRRFNALFQERYRLNPSAIRKQSRNSNAADMLRFELSYRPPYDWDGMLHFLSGRVMKGMEIVEDGEYKRTMRHGEYHGWISVKQSNSRNALTVEISSGLTKVMRPVIAEIKRQFDLNADPLAISDHLGELSVNNPGLRLPGAVDGFDMAIRAILGQQITVKAATTISGRVVERFGEPFDTGIPGLTHLAPGAVRLSIATVDEIAPLGIVSKRAQTIIGLSQAVVDGTVSLSPLGDPAQTIEKLKKIPGIGEWTAQYIAMRALSWPDAFPGSDLGILKALGGLKEKEAVKLSEKWRPWRSYAVIHLWRSLESMGV